MHYKEVKAILSANNGMNIYRGLDGKSGNEFEVRKIHTILTGAVHCLFEINIKEWLL